MQISAARLVLAIILAAVGAQSGWAQTVEEIQREIEEGPPRRIGPYDTEPDPHWWEEYYGEDIDL